MNTGDRVRVIDEDVEGIIVTVLFDDEFSDTMVVERDGTTLNKSALFCGSTYRQNELEVIEQ